MSRLTKALICYAVLGALAWVTLSDPRIRAMTLLVLGLFALKSVLRRSEALRPDEDQK
jgi:hypothetical protein